MAEAPVTYCTNCGAHLVDDAHFCGVCGHVRTGDPAVLAAAAAAAGTAPTSGPGAPGAPPGPPPPAPTPAPASAPAPVSPAVPPPAPGGVAYVAPAAASTPRSGGAALLIVGIVATIALVASLVVIVAVLVTDADPDPSREQIVPACTAGSSEPGCATSTTRTTAPTTSTTAAPPTTPVAPDATPAPTLPTAGTGDAGATAIEIASAAVASCPQGGMLGQFTAVELAPGVYQVSVPITFEGASVPDTAIWIVDLNAANGNLAAQNTAAEWLTCIGN